MGRICMEVGGEVGGRVCVCGGVGPAPIGGMCRHEEAATATGCLCVCVSGGSFERKWGRSSHRMLRREEAARKDGALA